MKDFGEYEKIYEAVEAVRANSGLRPSLALILGSGLGTLAREVEDSTVVPYAAIPHFPVSTAPGHAGELVLGRLHGKPVVVMSGRAHLYEGYSPAEVVFPLRTMRQLGAETLIVTNAAGAVNPSFHPGTLMIIEDHLNFTGRNPLIGRHDPRLGPKFPDMSRAYTPQLRDVACKVAERLGIAVAEGVYMCLQGPSFETPAEIRMARVLGADAVGMSTVMEVIAASQMGMKILGISCISNMAAGMQVEISAEEVIEVANSVQREFTALVRGVVEELE